MNSYIKHLLATVVLLLVSAPIWAADGDTFTANTDEGVRMNFRVISENEKTCQVGSIPGERAIGDTYSDAITIPSVVNGYTVTSIVSYAFYGCSSLNSINIPNGVTSIGERAFSGCSSLSSIALPASCTFGNWVFEDCTSLPVVNNIRYAGNWALEVIDKTQMLYTVRNGTTYLLPNLFSGCTDLMKVTLPSSLTAIGGGAFANCNGMISISIPAAVTSIGDYAFSGCSGLTTITIPSGVTSIGENAFFGCSGLTSITIPEGVTSIGYGAFKGCSGLTSITIPEGLTTIGPLAFHGCPGLTSITIPEGVTSIGSSAFQNCSSLTSITIPESVTNIGDRAFNCSSLTSITIPEGVTSIGQYAFGDCYGLTLITINCGNISTSGLFKDLSNLQEVTIGDKMSVLYNETFSGCSSLEKVTIGTGMEFIRTDAFKGCTSINTIECNAEVPPYCYPNVFADIDVSHCKLYVPEESVDAYANDEQWGAFDIVGLSFPSSIDLTDGETFEGYNRELQMEQITYSRTYKSTNWQSWYVPFELELTSDILSRFSFAKFAGTFVDEDFDPSFFISVVYMKEGETLKANTPYFIKAKTASNEAQVISVSNTTLKAAEEKGFDMYSAEKKVGVRGVYSPKTATAGDCDWYAFGGGGYSIATPGAVLKPYRFYITITDREDNPYGSSPNPANIKIRVLGEDGETVIEEVAVESENQPNQVYDLSGRRMLKDKLESGIYIINGKKVLVK